MALYGTGGLDNTALHFGRAAARVIPYRWMDSATSLAFGDRKVPNSFMPAKVSVLDNLYVPIREQFSEDEIRGWYAEEGFIDVERTKTTIYDHDKTINRLIHGGGFLQFRGKKQ